MATVNNFHVHGNELELFAGGDIVATLHCED
jgi:hypothetical protein